MDHPKATPLGPEEAFVAGANAPATERMAGGSGQGCDGDWFYQSAGLLFFGSGYWQRLAGLGAAAFVVGYISLLASGANDNPNFALWHGGGCLSYGLLVREVREWPVAVILGFLAFLAAHLAAGSDMVGALSNSMFSVAEAIGITVILKSVLALKSANGRIQEYCGSVSMLPLSICVISVWCAVVAILAGSIVDVPPQASFEMTAALWFLEHFSGFIIFGLFIAGILVELHWNYRPPGKAIAPMLLVAPIYLAAFWLALHFSGAQQEVPKIPLFMAVSVVLCLPLLLLPSMLIAGAFYALMSLVWVASEIVVENVIPAPAYLLVTFFGLMLFGTTAMRQYRSRMAGIWRATAENGPANLLGLDDQGRIVFSNRQLCALLGVKREQIINKPLSRVLHLQMDEPNAPQIEILPEGRYELRAILPNGALKIFLVSANSPSEPCLPFHRLATFEDVTEKHDARKQQLQWEQTAKVYLEAGTSLFMVRDREFNLKFVSGPLISLLGYDALEAMPPTSEWRTNRDLVAPSRDIFEAAGLGEVHQLPEFVSIKTADGKELLFREFFRWFLNAADGARMLMTSYENVTELVAERETSDHLRKMTENYLQAGINAFGVQDKNFEYLFMSQTYLDLTGYEGPHEMPPMELLYVDFDRTRLDDRKEELRLLSMGEISVPEIDRIRAADGRVLTIRSSSRWFVGLDGQPLLMTEFVDITKLQEQYATISSILDHSPAVILTENERQEIISSTETWTDLLGFSSQQTLGRDLAEFFVPSQRVALSRGRQAVIRSFGEARRFPRATLVTEAGTQVEVQIDARSAMIGGQLRVIILITDITTLTQTQDQLIHLVEHDELTGLLSRRGMNKRFEDRQRSGDFSLYLLDLDHFKSVNDGFGHDAGDSLLAAVGRALADMAQDDVAAIRLGGEEFAVLRPWIGWKDAETFAETLRLRVGDVSVDCNGRFVQRTVSIGYARLRQGDAMTDIMRLADMALEEAKTLGRNAAIAADNDLIEKLDQRGAFITPDEIKAALRKGEMRYFVQPIWGIAPIGLSGSRR